MGRLQLQARKGIPNGRRGVQQGWRGAWIDVGVCGLRRRDGADQQATAENADRGPGVLPGVHQERKEPETHPRPLRDETAPPSAGGPGGVASEGQHRPNGEVHPERFRPVRENRRENSPPKTPKTLGALQPQGFPVVRVEL